MARSTAVRLEAEGFLAITAFMSSSSISRVVLMPSVCHNLGCPPSPALRSPTLALNGFRGPQPARAAALPADCADDRRSSRGAGGRAAGLAQDQAAHRPQLPGAEGAHAHRGTAYRGRGGP